MAIIKCGECGTKISDKAKVCIKCGNPISNKKIYTTQETGKKLKLSKLISIILVIVGIVITTNSDGLSSNNVMGITITLIGIMGYIISRVLIWWRHS